MKRGKSRVEPLDKHPTTLRKGSLGVGVHYSHALASLDARWVSTVTLVIPASLNVRQVSPYNPPARMSLVRQTGHALISLDARWVHTGTFVIPAGPNVGQVSVVSTRHPPARMSLVRQTSHAFTSLDARWVRTVTLVIPASSIV